MKIRFILIALAGLFALIGIFFITFSGHDPAPRDSWQTYTGSLEAATFTDSAKLGRRVLVQLDNESEPRFALNHVKKYPGLEDSIAALKLGATVEVDAVPREQAGWAAPEGEPLSLLVLRSGREILYDRDRDNSGGEWIGTAVKVFGYLGVFVAALLSFLAFRIGSGRR